MKSNDCILISSLDTYPISHNDLVLGHGSAVLRAAKNGDIKGVVIGLASSVMSDREFELLQQTRECIFGPDNEGHITLDSEGEWLGIELCLRENGLLSLRISLGLFEFGDITTPDFTFTASIESWCAAVIKMSKETDSEYQLWDGYYDDQYDAKGYVKDLENFLDQFKNRDKKETVSSVAAKIKLSPKAPIVKSGHVV